MTLASSESKPSVPRSQNIAPRVGDPMFPPFSHQPASTPMMDRETHEQIRKRTKFGVIPARVGANVVVRIPNEDGESRVVSMSVQHVSLHRNAKTIAICTTCGEHADTAQELIDAHTAKFGGPAKMRAAGAVHVYALYSSDLTKRTRGGAALNPDGHLAQTHVEEPIGLLSDVEFTDG